MTVARTADTINDIIARDYREAQTLSTSKGLAANDIVMHETATNSTWDDVFTVNEYSRVYRRVRFTAANYKHLMAQLLHFIDFMGDSSQAVMRVYDSPTVSSDGSFKQWTVEVYSNVTQQVRIKYYVRCADKGAITAGAA